MPEFDCGWILEPSHRAAFLSYAAAHESVNWSDELEELHEESSRSHFIDRWTREAVLERIGPLGAGAAIADIGCSTGHLLEDLRAACPGCVLIGIDLVASGLRKAHEAVPEARLLHADACALPVLDGSLDAIVSANLLEHIRDDVRALREFARALRPGARAVLVVPAGPRTYDYYDRFLGHERRYARGELADKAQAAGLEVLEDGFIGSLLYPVFWLVKQRNRILRRGLEGVALERRVASDIARTRESSFGTAVWRAERRLPLRLPFGVRSLVVAQKPRSQR